MGTGKFPARLTQQDQAKQCVAHALKALDPLISHPLSSPFPPLGNTHYTTSSDACLPFALLGPEHSQLYVIFARQMVDGGNADAGAKLFKAKCATCHTCNEGGPNKQGPNLFGVIGRQSGQ